jgi:hypothetical protein
MVVAAWREYFTRLEHGRPIFDSALFNASLEAATRIRGNLARTLARFADGRSAEGLSVATAVRYLEPRSPALGDLIQRHANPLVSDFRLGSNVGLGSRDEEPSIPANWTPTPLLSGIAFVIYRPGLDRDVLGSAPFEQIERLPTKTFDFYEAFPNLDLAVAFRIATANDRLRSESVKAMSESLDALRTLDHER